MCKAQRGPQMRNDHTGTLLDVYRELPSVLHDSILLYSRGIRLRCVLTQLVVCFITQVENKDHDVHELIVLLFEAMSGSY
jgi:hypothetical protein